MYRKISFRLLGFVFVFAGVPLRFHPDCMLPQTFTYAGDFARSAWGQVYYGFADLMNVLVAVSALMLVLSFTTLTDTPRSDTQFRRTAACFPIRWTLFFAGGEPGSR